MPNFTKKILIFRPPGIFWKWKLWHAFDGASQKFLFGLWKLYLTFGYLTCSDWSKQKFHTPPYCASVQTATIWQYCNNSAVSVPCVFALCHGHWEGVGDESGRSTELKDDRMENSINGSRYRHILQYCGGCARLYGPGPPPSPHSPPLLPPRSHPLPYSYIVHNLLSAAQTPVC